MKALRYVVFVPVLMALALSVSGQAIGPVIPDVSDGVASGAVRAREPLAMLATVLLITTAVIVPTGLAVLVWTWGSRVAALAAPLVRITWALAIVLFGSGEAITTALVLYGGGAELYPLMRLGLDLPLGSVWFVMIRAVVLSLLLGLVIWLPGIHRRVIPVLLLLAGIYLTAGNIALLVDTPLDSNAHLARVAVARMRNAAAYTATGTESNQSGGQVLQGEETFTYVAPNTIRTVHTLPATFGGVLTSAELEGCEKREIVLRASVRHQRCLDSTGQTSEWISDSWLGVNYFESVLFTPWVRLLWCRNWERRGHETVEGELAVFLTCTVPPEMEARIIYLPTLQGDQLKGAMFVAKVWIREKDKYIVRFVFDAVMPKEEGPIRMTSDYTYRDINSADLMVSRPE